MNSIPLKTFTLALLSLTLTVAAGCGDKSDDEEKTQTFLVERNTAITIDRSGTTNEMVAHIWIDTNDNGSCEPFEILSADDSRVHDLMTNVVTDPITISPSCPAR